MAICKYCQTPMAWGEFNGRWVGLVPVGEDAGLDRAYQDENGMLRAAHALVCTRLGGAAVRVVKLARPVLAENAPEFPDPPTTYVETIDPETGEITESPDDQ